MVGQRFWLWVGVLAASAGAGLLYNLLVSGPSPLAAAIFGVFTGACIMAFERGLVLPRFQAWLRGRPPVLYVLLAEATYVVLIVTGNAIGGTIVWALELLPGSWGEIVGVTPRVLIYALAVSAMMVLIVRTRDLLGAQTFVNLMLGRYYRPVREEKVFLLVDVVGSTAFAEQHGDLRAQEWLGTIFAAMAEPIRRHRGAVDDYIGDLAMVSWPLARGIENARCIRCLADICATLHKERERWVRDFGEPPRVRAALHAGTIVTAEIGVDRHKIAYFGDTLNVAARLEGLCKELGEDVLISASLLDLIPALPEGIAAVPLGDHALKGRDQALAVAALRLPLASGVTLSTLAR